VLNGVKGNASVYSQYYSAYDGRGEKAEVAR
jgi:hypothetical protein